MTRPRKGESLAFIMDVALTYTDPVNCLIWPYGCDSNGYAMFNLHGTKYVSRFICEKIHGPAPTPKHHAAHLCGQGNNGCVNPLHIVWKTPKQNQADRVIHRTHNAGERNYNSVKLTESDVREIRRSIAADDSYRNLHELAHRYGVSYVNIYAIRIRRSWRHLK